MPNIDYSTMKVGEKADLPHKSAWEGANQNEYRRAQAYAAAQPQWLFADGTVEIPQPQFEVTQNMQPDGLKPIPDDQPGCGFRITRVR